MNIVNVKAKEIDLPRRRRLVTLDDRDDSHAHTFVKSPSMPLQRIEICRRKCSPLVQQVRVHPFLPLLAAHLYRYTDPSLSA
jgi:hypothetical protein